MASLTPDQQQLYSQQAAANAFRFSPGVLEFPSDATKFLDGNADFETVAGGGGVLQQASFTLSAAQLIALPGNGIEILPAVAGKRITIPFAVFEYIPGTTPFTSSGAPVLYLTRTACVASILANVGVPPGQNNFFTGESLFGNVSFRQGIHLDTLTGTIDTEAFFFSGDEAEAINSGISVCMVGTDNLAAGDGQVKVTIFYVVL